MNVFHFEFWIKYFLKEVFTTILNFETICGRKYLQPFWILKLFVEENIYNHFESMQRSGRNCTCSSNPDMMMMWWRSQESISLWWKTGCTLHIVQVFQWFPTSWETTLGPFQDKWFVGRWFLKLFKTERFFELTI